MPELVSSLIEAGYAGFRQQTNIAENLRRGAARSGRKPGSDKTMKLPAAIHWLGCVLKGGHRYGRWWWPERAEAAHQLCECCADMRTPKNRHSWFHRERTN